MKINTLLLLACMVLFISCGCEDDEKSDCYKANYDEITFAKAEYDLVIAEIRDPDGSWHTHEQCVEQHEAAEIYLQRFKDAQENTDFSNSDCSAAEIRELKSRMVAIISELDADVNINYVCD